MIVWCVVLYSMGWVPSSATWYQRSSIVLGSHKVEYDPMHHTNLVFFLCHGFNNFWPLNIQIWIFLWFWKNIPHGQKSIPHTQRTYHMVMISHMIHTKCYIMWYASNHVIRIKFPFNILGTARTYILTSNRQNIHFCPYFMMWLHYDQQFTYHYNK